VPCPAKLSHHSGCKSQPEQEPGRSVAGGGRWAKSQRLSAATSPKPRVSALGCELSGRSIKRILLPRDIQKPKGNKAEPHILRRRQKTVGRTWKSTAGLVRGTGDGTIGRDVTEQERPSWMFLEWESRAYKAEPKAPGVQRESDELIVPMTWRQHNLREGKGLYLGQARVRG